MSRHRPPHAETSAARSRHGYSPGYSPSRLDRPRRCVDQAGTADHQIELDRPAPDATTLTPGTPASGNIEEYGSVDQYTFQITTPSTITFHGEACPTGTSAEVLAGEWSLAGFDPCLDHTNTSTPTSICLRYKPPPPAATQSRQQGSDAAPSALDRTIKT
jgi:hypothetical protein